MSGLEVVAAFGALSSFLQVAEFTANVARQAYKQVQSGQEVLDENVENTKLAKEYERLGGLFHNENAKHAQSEQELSIVRIGRLCQEEAQKLLGRLERLEVDKDTKGFRRVAETAKQVARARLMKEEIANHRRYLLELNSQLSTALLHAFWAQQLKNSIERQRSREAEQAEIRIKGLDKLDIDQEARASRVEKIRQERIKPDAEITAELTTQLALSKRELDDEITSIILRSLDFGDLTVRWQDIHVAYPRTYQWALTEETLGFRRWLQTGNGIFWISGKAGSGKSTLIKFLEGADETRALLKEWCEDRELVIATFYFWYLGSDLQKSTDGLIRTILYRIVSRAPALAPIAFPSRFDYGPYTRQGAVDKKKLMRFTSDELVTALENIATYENTAQSKRFCLFIDGLDEYHGNHVQLIGLLRRLAKNPVIKVCVSSRPWNAFRRAFQSGTPNLKLEDLSYPDMQRYVQGSLDHMIAELAAVDAECGTEREDEDGGQEVTVSMLTNEIASRGEGVFLWVHLVTKSVLAGLAEGEPIWMLRRRVQHFPADLEDFFQQILGRVDGLYKQHTAQALKLAFMYARGGESAEVSWFDFWLMSQFPDGLSDPSFTLDTSPRTINPKIWKKMLDETRIFLSSACKDLLVAPQEIDITAPRSAKVAFLHRTVYEFLTAEPMQQAIDDQVPALFKDGSILPLLSLPRCKATSTGESFGSVLGNLDEPGKNLFSAPIICITDMHVTQYETTILHHRDVFLEKEAAIGMPGNSRNDSIARFTVGSALAPLVAHGKVQYVTDLLRAMTVSNTNPFGSKAFDVEGVLTAALGEHPAKRAGLTSSSHEILQLLLRFSTWFCVCNHWHLFVRKWAMEKEHLSEERDLSRVWSIAKLFLRASKSLKLSECMTSFWHWKSVPKDSDVFSARAFVEEQIPASWLEEDGWEALSSSGTVSGTDAKCSGSTPHRFHYQKRF